MAPTVLCRVRVVAQGDPLPDEDGIDLVEPAVEADGAVLVYDARGLEEKDLVEVERGIGVAHAGRGERPLLERGTPVEAAMRAVVILALDPRPEAAVQRLQAVRGPRVEVGEPAGAKGSEEALDLALRQSIQLHSIPTLSVEPFG